MQMQFELFVFFYILYIYIYFLRLLLTHSGNLRVMIDDYKFTYVNHKRYIKFLDHRALSAIRASLFVDNDDIPCLRKVHFASSIKETKNKNKNNKCIKCIIK